MALLMTLASAVCLCIWPAIGVMQWHPLRQRGFQSAWGWALGSTAILLMLGLFLGDVRRASTLVMPGCVIGYTQWLVIRQKIPNSDWWVLHTTLGWSISGIVTYIILINADLTMFAVSITNDGSTAQDLSTITLLLMGAGVGMSISQWRLLRRQVDRSEWWLLVTTSGWIVAMLVAFLLFESQVPTWSKIEQSFEMGTDLPYEENLVFWRILLAWFLTIVGASVLFGAFTGSILAWLPSRLEGVEDHFEVAPREDSMSYYSCFISYSSQDEEFAEKLYASLRSQGIKTWYAPEKMKIGDKIWQTINRSIRSYNKLLLVLSKHSINSYWVETEVEAAIKEESRRKETVLFPIQLDNAVRETDQTWADYVTTRHIGNFQNWKDQDAYKKAFERLLRDLRQGSV